MSWSEVWSNSSTFLNIHCADFKSILLMQIFRGGKRPVIPVNHQCHWVIAFLPYRESPVCGYTWVVKDTSFVFSNHMGYLYTISKWPWWWEGRNNNNNKNNKCYCSCCYSVTKSCFLFVIPWTAAHHGSLPFTIFQSLRKFMSNKSVVLSNHLILYFPLLFLHSIISSIWVFSQMSQFFSSVGQSVEL